MPLRETKSDSNIHNMLTYLKKEYIRLKSSVCMCVGGERASTSIGNLNYGESQKLL